MPREPGRGSSPSYSLLALVGFFAVAYILYPLWSLVRESTGGAAFSLDAYRGFLRPSLLEAAFNSVLISILSVAGSAVVGTFLAYVLNFVEMPAKNIFSRALLIPLALPPLVGVISFLFLIGESGMLSRILSAVLGIPTSYFTVSGWSGIVIVHVYSFYVYFYLLVSSAFSQLDGNALDASASLGANRWTTIRKVLLPLLTPALVAASLMTFMASMASFSAPLLFGGTTRFLTLEIYTAKLNGDDSSAAALSILLAVISILTLVLLRWWQSHRRVLIESKGARRASVIVHGPWLRRTLIASTSAIALLFSLPILTIIVLSFVKEASWTYQIFPSVFTAENYSKLLSEKDLLAPMLNSLRMAAVATLLAAVIGVAASYLITRKPFRGSRLLEAVLSIPFGIPGTVIAIGLILSFSRATLFSFDTILIGTFWIMPLAYAVRNLPLLQRSTTAGFEAIGTSLYDAAEVLGSRPTMTFRRVILPLVMPSIVSGALLVFVNSAGEFVSSILLYSYSTKPVSVEILSQLRLFNIGGAAVQSTLLMVLVFFVIAASQRVFRSAFSA